jgi:hypothetical protein
VCIFISCSDQYSNEIQICEIWRLWNLCFSLLRQTSSYF